MQKNAGFSLIELLVSLLILSLVLLGFDALEIYAVRQSRETYFFNVAEEQVHSMVERLRAHALADDVLHQFTLWNEENQQLLPMGNGYITGSYPLYQITLFWGEMSSKRICHETRVRELNCMTTTVQL